MTDGRHGIPHGRHVVPEVTDAVLVVDGPVGPYLVLGAEAVLHHVSKRAKPLLPFLLRKGAGNMTYLGIDVGGSSIKHAVMDGDYTIISQGVRDGRPSGH